MDTRSLHTTPLAAGQCLHLAVDAGTVLVAAQGCLRVDEAPRWLAERLVPVGAAVAEGQAYLVAQTGWLCVTAQGAASLARMDRPRRNWRLPAWLAPWRDRQQPAAC